MVGVAIALVGMTLAGKTEVSNFLKSRGFGYIRLGAITEKKLKEAGLENTEATNQVMRKRLREEYGMEAYAKLNYPEIEGMLKNGDVVIDNMMSWSEYKYFKTKIKKFFTVAVYAPPKVRYVRAETREVRSTKDFFKKNTPTERDYSEIENLEKGGPIAMADYTIDNSEQGKARLQEELDKFWKWFQHEA